MHESKKTEGTHFMKFVSAMMFLFMTPKVQAIKAIIDKWDFIKLRVSAHQREQATD